MAPIGHIAGIPVEETLLYAAPVGLVGLRLLVPRLRELTRRLRPRRTRR